MEFTALDTVEYHKIREMLAEKTGSSMGREIAEGLLPKSDLEGVRKLLDETEEAVGILAGYTNVPLGGIRDVRAIIKRARLSATLESHELAAVGSTLYASRRVKSFLGDLREYIPVLSTYVDNIFLLRNIEQIIENTVSEHGGIRDDASMELKRIRLEIKSAQSRVKDKLENILRSSENQKLFQDSIVTVRSDRYVIPVKQEYRHVFPGIVHDQSASGATVFIEPMPIVNLNNEIKQLMSAEKNEIDRILRIVSGKIAEEASHILLNCEMLAHLDFVFAKARLALAMKAVKPLLNKRGIVDIKQARHPLISSQDVVPVDIEIGKRFNTLIITGPNTGGKTVSLKTLGLFTLMTQAGLFIPASSGAEMAVFNSVFADIGDEQSIENSLSTFSAHMTNLVKILGKVTNEDLVLIDEIGSGTDPDEGAALAMAILDYLLELGAKTIATTHYSELKSFAFSRQGVENASVEFNIQTLRPTYRLLIGIPGSSNAFAISKRLGLSGEIIENARQFIEKGHADMETMLIALEDQKRLYNELNGNLEMTKRQADALKAELDQEKADLEQKKKLMILKARNDAAAITRTARRQAEDIIDHLKSQFAEKDVHKRQEAINSARSGLREQANSLTSDVDDTANFPPIDKEKLKPGMSVYVTTLKQKGVVLRISGDELTVQMGVLKTNIPLSLCRMVGESKKTDRITASNLSESRLPQIRDVVRQVDIRGMTVEEAEEVLAKFLDDALLAGLNEVLVIHGKGTGSLRKGVRLYLKNHQHVREAVIAGLSEGGNGATVVRLI
jgi:DNA mismatch repair protein MutS2